MVKAQSIVLHPQPIPDMSTFQCPVCGRLRCGFSSAQVLQLRQSAARNFLELGGDGQPLPDGTPYTWIGISTSCGTIHADFIKGQNDQGDGLPTIQAIGIQDLEIPCRGARRVIFKNADQNAIGSTATDVSELGAAVLAGERIRFRGQLIVQTSAVGVGGMIAANGPAASLVGYETREWSSASAESKNTQTALDAFSTQTTGNGASPRLYTIEGIAVFTADGTFILRAKAESAGTMNVLAGSFMEYDLI